MTRPLPFGLTAYRTLTGLLAPLAPWVLQARARRGKEAAGRTGERLGQPSLARPEGRLIWLHGASVGESLVAWTMARTLQAREPGLEFLITSGTVTSADVIAGRIAGLPPAEAARFRHQFVPVDTPGAVAGFMAHWRPDLAVFVEGEIWPNLLAEARARSIPTALINARMTARSLARWKRAPASAAAVFGGFDLIAPADRTTATGLAALAPDVAQEPAGNLKLSAPVASPDPDALAALRQQIGTRPLWLAASTHEGEERVIVAAHAMLKIVLPDLLLILAPRHPDRAPDVRVTCTLSGMDHVSRSQEGFVGPKTEILIWDTLGELPLACALAPVTLLAGSLVDRIGGHNPVEPVALGSAVVTGPYGYNFADVFAAMAEAGGIAMIEEVNGDRIAMQVAGLLGDPDRRDAMVAAARGVIAAGAGAGVQVADRLMALLPGAR